MVCFVYSYPRVTNSKKQFVRCFAAYIQTYSWQSLAATRFLSQLAVYETDLVVPPPHFFL
jgi:hypothetical protein